MKTTRKKKSKGTTKRPGRSAAPAKSGKQAVSKPGRKRGRTAEVTDGRIRPVRGSAGAPQTTVTTVDSLAPHARVARRAAPASQRSLSHRSPSGSAQPSLAAFNPALPVDGSLIIAGELRDQFSDP